MSILVTGFKGKNNSSALLAQAVADRLSDTGAQVDVLLLTNSFEGLRRDLDRLTEQYSAVIMLGLDSSLADGLRVEATAALGGEVLVTTLNVHAIAEYLSAHHIDCDLCDSPTAYLCNAAYFHMLKKSEGRAVFIHIPPKQHVSVEKIKRLAVGLADAAKELIK